MDSNQAMRLLENYRKGTCSPEEKLLVEAWYAQLVETGQWQWGEGEKEHLKNLMEARLLSQINLKENEPLRRLRSLRTIRWWAAASVVLLLGAGSYFVFLHHKPEITKPDRGLVKSDVKAPQTNRATITLSGGQKIFLDSANEGTLARQNNISIVKAGDGKLVYESFNPSAASGAGVNAGVFNTLTNPKGSKVIDMTLSDGSRVWLNAGSSLTYPVAFLGSERKVSITGEAYFEVKHNDKMPFTVSANGVDVHDLGTSFNINAYDDEEAVKVTLLEGSIRTSIGSGQSSILKPGQQAAIHGSQLRVRDHVDPDEVIAWKNNLFDFRGDKIQAVMRQISRWYDVDVQYSGDVTNEDFVGSVSRLQNVSQVLKLMETTKKVKFEIDGRKIIVMLP